MAKPGKGCSERHVRLRIARVKFDRPPQQLQAALVLPDIGDRAASISEDIRGVWIDSDSARGFFARLRFSAGRVLHKRQGDAERAE